MKLNDVTKTDDEALYEALDTDNDTGVSTENLVKMAKADKSDEWTRYSSVDEYFAHLDNMVKLAASKQR